MEAKVVEETNEEKRERAAKAILANPLHSDRMIVRETGISQSTIFRVRRTLEAMGKLERIDPDKRTPGMPGMRRSYMVKREGVIEAELLKDPTRSNRQIASVTGAHYATVRLVREKLEAEGKIAVVGVRERRYISGRTGGITVPEGTTLSELIKKGMNLEDEGLTAEECSEKIGIGTVSYRMGRNIVLLAGNEYLSPKDMAMVKAAITLMDESRSLHEPYEMVKPIAKRVWGRGRNVHPTKKTAATVLKKFHHAITVITETCSSADSLIVPPLDLQTVTTMRDQLSTAANSVNALKKRLTKGITTDDHKDDSR